MGVKIYKIVLTVVTIACVIFGSIYHIGGFVLNATGVLRNIPVLSRFVDKIDIDLDESSLGTVDIGKDLSGYTDFTAIDVDAEYINVTIVEGDAYNVDYQTSNTKLVPDFDLSDGKLTISQDVDNFNAKNNMRSDLTITVPSGVELTDIMVKTELGNIDVSDIEAETVSLESELGEVDVDHVKSEDLTAITNLGDVTVTGEIKNVNAESEMGNVKVTADKLAKKAEVILASQMGDVKFYTSEDLDQYSVSLETEMGETKFLGESHGRSFSRDGNKGTIEMKTEMGDVSVKKSDDN